MSYVPPWVVKALIFTLIFTTLFAFLTFIFVGNTYGTYASLHGITADDIGIGGGWFSSDSQNLTYNTGWKAFNKTAMGNYEYQGGYGNGTYGSQNYTRFQAKTGSWLWYPWWANMYPNTYSYAYPYLNATDIILHFDYTKNYTKTYWRAYQDHDDTGWDLYVFFRDYDTSRNNITQSLMQDGKVLAIIAKQWSMKQAGFFDFVFWFGAMINPFTVGYGISSIQIIALFMQLITLIDAVCLIILAKYLVSGWL